MQGRGQARSFYYPFSSDIAPHPLTIFYCDKQHGISCTLPYHEVLPLEDMGLCMYQSPFLLFFVSISLCLSLSMPPCFMFYLPYLPINCPSVRICPFIAFSTSCFVAPEGTFNSLSRAYTLKK